MIIYNNKASYSIFDKSMIPMGSIVFDAENGSLSILNSSEGLIEISIPKADMETKFSLSNLPDGATVDFGKHIRIFCPANTKWKKQNVGPTGNSNIYYCAFKAYAPEDKSIISFKEGDRGTIVDRMHTFNEEFSGIDENGKFSIIWLALALYNTETDNWNYFGNKSTTEKYIGWDYIVEWYNANGEIVASDSVRIDLTNENC